MVLSTSLLNSIYNTSSFLCLKFTHLGFKGHISDGRFFIALPSYIIYPYQETLNLDPFKRTLQ